MMKLSSYKLLKNKPSTEKQMQFANIILLGLWVLFQYFFGDKFYSIFIIIFFLILANFRRHFFVLYVISVLFIVFVNTQTVDTVVKLKQSNFIFIQYPRQPLTNILMPDSGQEILPTQVQSMLSLLHTYHIPNYNLSFEFTQDQLIKQRITEAAWPIKMESSSSYLLSTPKELINNSNCIVIDQIGEIALADCH